MAIKLRNEISMAHRLLFADARGLRWNGFEWVDWRQEKRRKRKLMRLNLAVVKRARMNANAM